MTELVTGLDLVELQLRVAAGEPLPPRSGRRRAARVTRSRPGSPPRTRRADFLPAAGRVLAYARPQTTREVRVDDAIEVGTVVDTSYDSLLAKVIAHGDDRAEALGRLDAGARAVHRARA